MMSMFRTVAGFDRIGEENWNQLNAKPGDEVE